MQKKAKAIVAVSSKNTIFLLIITAINLFRLNSSSIKPLHYSFHKVWILIELVINPKN